MNKLTKHTETINTNARHRAGDKRIMKYICTVDDIGREEIFTFSNNIDHDTFHEGVTALRNQTWGDWERIFRSLISAGFVSKELECYGKSETLKIESRGDKDTELLKKQFSL